MQELETGPLHRFQDWPNEEVPKRAAGVSTVWEGDRLLYVGMSGRAMTAEDLEVSDGGRIRPKELWIRLNTQRPAAALAINSACMSVTASWSRASPHPSSNSSPPGALSLDTLMRAFVHERLSYRFVITADGTRRSGGNERFGEDHCPPASPISTHWRHNGSACAV